MKKHLLIALLISLFVRCDGDRVDIGGDESYRREIENWRKERIERLQSPAGWLTLAGLFWLAEGANSFGSAGSNDIVFPDPAPARVGVFELENGTEQVTIAPDVKVLCEGQPVSRLLLQSDLNGNPTILTWGALSWYLIDRQGRQAIRLKNNNSPELKNFTGIAYFPIELNWKVPARLERFDPPRKIRVPNILGGVSEETCPGELLFDIGGQAATLTTIEDGTESLLVIFADGTSGRETYGGGRFLRVALPDTSGMTIVDFNKAYNPPCAFTPYATCSLPPEQNRLAIAVTAGEKSYGNH